MFQNSQKWTWTKMKLSITLNMTIRILKKVKHAFFFQDTESNKNLVDRRRLSLYVAIELIFMNT